MAEVHHTCSTQMRFRPSAHGDGFVRCDYFASWEVVYPKAKSRMMRGPFYICDGCKTAFIEQIAVDGGVIRRVGHESPS